MQEVTTTIQTDGSSKIEVKGVKGRSCTALTADFEKALGKKVSDTPTKEMYENDERVSIRNRS